MPALRQQDRQMRSVVPLNFSLVPGEGRQHFRDGAVKLLVDLQFLHLAFGQLRVAHDFGDDAVGALDLFADDLNLLQAGVFAFEERALNGIGGVVDDAQRILYLVGDLRGQLPGRAQLLLPGREFTGFFRRLPLLLEQDLDAVATGRHERQHEETQEERLGRVFGDGPAQFVILQDVVLDRQVQQPGGEVAEDDRKIQDQLRHRQRTAYGVAHDQTQENPIQDAVETARQKGQRGQKKAVHEIRGKDHALDKQGRQPAREKQQERHDGVEHQIDQEKALDNLLGDRPRQGQVLNKPARIVEIIKQNPNKHRLHRQNDV